MREGRLAGKTCIITGTGGGIGGASAAWFCREGARVVGCDIDPERSAATVKAVREAGGEMVSLDPCDLTDAQQCKRLVELAVDAYGGIDVLFNCAAMAYFGWIPELSEADFKRTLNEEVNLVFLLTQAAWPHLIARGGGSIINVASVAAHQPHKIVRGVAHSAAKGAVLSMTRSFAMEGGPHKIRANSISPGPGNRAR